MAADLEPIDIDINMRQNVSEESGKAAQGISDMTGVFGQFDKSVKKSEEELKVLTEHIRLQREVLSSLEEQYKAAKKTYDGLESVNADAATQYEEAKRLLADINTELEEQKEHLNYLEVAQKKADISKNIGAVREVNQEWDSVLTTAVEYANAIQHQREHIKNLNAELLKTKDDAKGLQGVINSIQAETPYKDQKQSEYRDLIAKSKELAATIKDEEDGLRKLTKGYNDLKKQQDKSITNTQKEVTILTQIRKIREEMATLVNKDGTVSPENLQRYEQLKAKLGEVGIAYRKIQEEQKLLTTKGNAQLTGLIQGISGLSGVLTAGQGFFALFIKDNEKLAAIQTKLQAVMSITIGLQAASSALHQTSAFRIATVTKGTQMLATAQTWLATTLGISNVAAKALMATLTLGLSLAITGIIYLLDSLSDESNKASEAIKKFNESAASNAAKHRTEFERLRQQWIAANGDLKKQEKLVRENIDAYNSFGVVINGVNDAESMFVTNADAFVQSINKRALAAAAMELASEKYKESIQKMLEAEQHEKNPSVGDYVVSAFDKAVWWTSNVISPGTYTAEQYEEMSPLAMAKRASEKEKAKADKLREEAIENIQKALGLDKETTEYLKNLGYDVSDEITEGSKIYWEKIRDAQQKIMNTNLPDSDNFKSAKKQRNAADKMLEQWSKTNFKGQESQAAKLKKQQEAAQKKLEKSTLDYQNRIDAARIAAMQEGAEKERAATRAEHDKTKRLIEQELTELAELEKITDKPATEQRTRLIELDVATTAEYEAKMRQINETSKKEIDAIFADAGQRFRSELDNNLLQINQYYDKLVLEARKAGADTDKINELNTLRDKELEQERIDAKIQSLEFDTQIALRRMAISGKFYLFESDKIKESLQTQKQAAQQRLKLLQEQYKKSKTKELERDIEAATVEIEEMDAAIRNLDLSKFQELAGYVNQIASGLSSLAGDNSSAGKFMEWMGGLADGAGQIAAGISTGNPAAVIDGAFKAVNTIKDIFSTSSSVRKEIRQFYQELEASATQFAISVINTIKDITGSADSIFSTDITNNLTKGMEGYNAAVQKEKDLVQQLGDTTVQVGKKKKKFLGITTGSKTVWESILTGYKKVLDTDEELVDASGQLNREMAEALLNSGKLSTEAEALINNILSAQDAATAAMQQVESTLSNIAGSIGDDLRNALVEAFKNGDVTAAADSFGQSASKILEDWITQTMFSSVFGDMLSELEGKMKDSFGGNGDQDITDDIAWFMQNYQSGVDEYMKGLEKWKQQLKDLYGIEVFGDGEREGTSAGLERISQDSANELNGNFYALRQQVGDIRNLHKEANVMRKAMQAQLDRIAENTEYCRYLLDVKNSLDDMQSRGIKIKA